MIPFSRELVNNFVMYPIPVNNKPRLFHFVEHWKVLQVFLILILHSSPKIIHHHHYYQHPITIISLAVVESFIIVAPVPSPPQQRRHQRRKWHPDTTLSIMFLVRDDDRLYQQQQQQQQQVRKQHQLLRMEMKGKIDDIFNNNNNEDMMMSSLISNVIANLTTTTTTEGMMMMTRIENISENRKESTDCGDRNHQQNETKPGMIDHSNEYWINIGAAVTEDEVVPLVGKVKSLGIDYGLARTGIAMTIGYEPIPLSILQSSQFNNNITAMCLEIIQYVTRYQIQQVIVGLPLHKNGTIAQQTNVTLHFTKQLAQQVLCQLGPKIPVLLFDERYTSKMAAAREHMKHPSSALYGTLDATAACIILENYYEDQGVGAYHVQIEPEFIRQKYIQKYYQLQQEKEEHKLKQHQNEVDQRLRRIRLIAESKLQDQIKQQQQQQQLLRKDDTNNSDDDGVNQHHAKKRKKKKKK